jgi:hypothetical protein
VISVQFTVISVQFTVISRFIPKRQSQPFIQLRPLDYKKAVLLSICALKPVEKVSNSGATMEESIRGQAAYYAYYVLETVGKSFSRKQLQNVLSKPAFSIVYP